MSLIYFAPLYAACHAATGTAEHPPCSIGPMMFIIIMPTVLSSLMLLFSPVVFPPVAGCFRWHGRICHCHRLLSPAFLFFWSMIYFHSIVAGQSGPPHTTSHFLGLDFFNPLTDYAQEEWLLLMDLVTIYGWH